jgi:hypothetical protein
VTDELSEKWLGPARPAPRSMLTIRALRTDISVRMPGMPNVAEKAENGMQPSHISNTHFISHTLSHNANALVRKRDGYKRRAQTRCEQSATEGNAVSTKIVKTVASTSFMAFSHLVKAAAGTGTRAGTSGTRRQVARGDVVPLLGKLDGWIEFRCEPIGSRISFTIESADRVYLVKVSSTLTGTSRQT